MATQRRTTTKKTGSAKQAKAKKLSQIDAAIKVLGQSKKPMTCKELVEAMARLRLVLSV